MGFGFRRLETLGTFHGEEIEKRDSRVLTIAVPDFMDVGDIHSAAEPQPKFHRTVISSEGRELVRSEFHQNKKISPFGRNDRGVVKMTMRSSPPVCFNAAGEPETGPKHSRGRVDCRGGIAYLPISGCRNPRYAGNFHTLTGIITLAKMKGVPSFQCDERIRSKFFQDNVLRILSFHPFHAWHANNHYSTRR